MSDDLVKLEWDIRSGGGASTHLPFGSYFVEEYQFSGWQWSYCFYEYYDEGSYSCKDTADGMSLAEEHWRDRVQFITKPLTDRIEELEAKLAKAEAILEREIRRVQKIQEDLPPPHNVGLAHVEEEYILILKEIRGEYVDGK